MPFSPQQKHSRHWMVVCKKATLIIPSSPGSRGECFHVLKKSLLGRRRLGGKPTMAEAVRPTENLNEGSYVPG